MSRKKLLIFGSTGSIGRRALDVARDFPDEFQIVGLSARRDIETLAGQIREFRPRAACLADPARRDDAGRLAAEFAIPVFSGTEGLTRLAGECAAEMAVAATVGVAGLAPALAALDAGCDLALANKETLVAAGEIVMARARERGARILPIDSEHSAIFQCLGGLDASGARRIILTASGGPFRGASDETLRNATVEQALAHPTWNMGKKVSIDSATLMNKGLEVIEARHLFGLDFSQIEVVIHPQSVVHSLVEFVDGSILAQMGPTDMYLPIQAALTWPRRLANTFAPLDLARLKALEFEAPALERFPCLSLAYEAGRRGGTAPAALNAANEVAVARFLQKDIGFPDIPAVIRDVMDHHTPIDRPALEDILAASDAARQRAETYGLRA